jgi:hypothetical protein
MALPFLKGQVSTARYQQPGAQLIIVTPKPQACTGAGQLHKPSCLQLISYQQQPYFLHCPLLVYWVQLFWGGHWLHWWFWLSLQVHTWSAQGRQH